MSTNNNNIYLWSSCRDKWQSIRRKQSELQTLERVKKQHTGNKGKQLKIGGRKCVKIQTKHLLKRKLYLQLAAQAYIISQYVFTIHQEIIICIIASRYILKYCWKINGYNKSKNLQQSSLAGISPTVADNLLVLHSSNFVVVVPTEFCAGWNEFESEECYVRKP